MSKNKSNNQNIKCNVKSCKFQNTINSSCTLKEIEVDSMETSTSLDKPTDKKETICKSFKYDK